MLNLRSFALAGIFAFAVFAVSCNKADDLPEPMFVEENVELKKGQPEGVSNGAPEKGDMTIADIVVASSTADEPQFTLLLAALEYAGLTSVFAGSDQYTVFAPTDQAFINLVTAVESLLDPVILNDQGPFAAIDALLGSGTIANVLLYHVTEGRRAANSVVPKMNPRTIETLLSGATFSVDVNRKIWAVGNSAMIVDPNISASNGIIHVIDTVILPIEL